MTQHEQLDVYVFLHHRTRQTRHRATFEAAAQRRQGVVSFSLSLHILGGEDQPRRDLFLRHKVDRGQDLVFVFHSVPSEITVPPPLGESTPQIEGFIRVLPCLAGRGENAIVSEGGGEG